MASASFDIDSDDEIDPSPLLSPGPRSGKKVAGGFRLNYDEKTPIRAIDLGGQDQGEKLAEFVTTAIDNLSHDINVKGAMEELKLQGPRDIIPGLEVRLLGHQCIGVAWMLRMERSKNRGGILADDMGLGKTVQMIATMVMNPPTRADECKTTLIVVPAALMEQWKEEILTKTNDIFSVHIHHGRDKLTESQIKKKDVIITSYQTLCNDFSTPSDVSAEEEAQWVAENGGPLARLHFYRVIADEAQFIRNRATRASISMALVRATYRWTLTGTPVTNTLADIYGLLRFGRFRPWNDWNDFNEHVAKVQSEDAPLAGSRAQAILKPLILRRTKNSTLEGKPILNLPPKDIEIVKLQFSPDEREVYDSFEKSTKIRLNKFIRERTLLKNHAQVLVMILRLRQVCCHPHLVLSQAEGLDDPTALVQGNAEKELGRARKTMGPLWVADVKKEFLLRAASVESVDFSDEDDTAAPGCPVCGDVFSNDSGRVLSCKHEMCFDCMLNTRNGTITHDGIFGYGTEKENQEAEKAFEEAAAKGYRPCPTCRKMVDLSDAKTFKSSAFEPSDEELRQHAQRKANRSRNRYSEKKGKKKAPSPPPDFLSDLDDSDDDLPEISDIFKTPKKKGKGKRVDSSDDDMAVDDAVSNKSKGKRKADSDSEVEFLGMTPSRRKRVREAERKGNASDSSDVEFMGMTPSRRKRKEQEDDSPSPSNNKKSSGPSDAVLATWKRGDDDLEASAKMLKLVEYLKEWDDTGDKTICYSQWTSMLDLLEKLLSRHGIRTLRFDGQMDRAAREYAISSFKRAGGPKVMLISTRCGSVGLNLVMANRIVNMDLSWNYAAESQAYDRCHRIGQDKDVFVKRLVVENTIEERMLRLQDVKVGLAEAALGEGSGAKLHRLSVKEIKYLFGMGPLKKPGNNGRNGSADSDSD
ncbi:hypothetical protein CC1G_08756 [Coprinopsis cinerea okayama7|uniref:Uncharacterized protein n=1 Tax=Coprinopsis cinerea (strain Okayama-7 / 130 / ATCC MYA-4618 / FGSC 9003) TaxID=240176 RepID=A8NJ18_COPC7|nr:hypothetical protein CC1G_08756 [Coprinopsis cinerea okayama7\|eukprot:XP_001834125.1 hypothetical protein CC1G_08756 [Coprinopsis cinerea okayama7\